MTITLDYSAGVIQAPFEPTPDDAATVNDVTVARPGGGEHRERETSGALSTQAPPNGVGRYDRTLELNVDSDHRLPDVAGWALLWGTWDEDRYPQISVNLRQLSTVSAGLLSDAEDHDLGDRVIVENPPEWLPAEAVEQLTLGYTETLHVGEWRLDWHTGPARPLRVGQWQSDSATPDPAAPARYDTAGSEVTSGLLLTGTSGDYASTPDAAALDITGDLDLRVEATLDDWTSFGESLIAKYDTGTDQRSYQLRTENDGALQLLWSEDGIGFTGVISDEAVSSGRLAVRATLDVDDGTGNHSVAFYTADSIDGPWTQLGTVQTGSGTTSVHAGTAPLEVGSRDGGTANLASGVIHAAQVLDGIDGTLVADVDFTGQTSGATSIVDDAGLTWTVHGDAAIVGAFEAGTDTELVVTTTSGSVWTTDAADLPFDVAVAGVRLRVTGIAGTAPQTFTVQQTPVNGVTKTIPAGSAVSLWRPARWAL